MRNVLGRWLVAGALITLVGSVVPAQASPILPGGTVAPVLEDPGGCPCGGPFLADTTLIGWGSGSFAGLYRSVVYQNAGGGLEFWYQVANDDTSSVIHELLMTSFLGWGTDVFYHDVGGSGSIIPTMATRSASGHEIGFHFDSLDPDEVTQVVLIRTNASAFTSGHLVISTGGSSPTQVMVSAFAPTPIPEPASLTLLGLGLAGFAHRLRRSRE